MQKLKKILLAVGLIVVLNTNLVEAQENTADNRIAEEENIEKGSIRIALTDGKQGTKKENVEFQCVKVADLINGGYMLTEAYEETKIDLNTIIYSNELDEAAKILAEKNVDCETKKTDTNGEAVFHDLETGLYLLKAEETGSYDNVMPALIGVPTWNEIEKVMEYDVTVVPKHSAEAEVYENETVKTGDYEEVFGYVILTGVSILSIVYFAVKRKRI